MKKVGIKATFRATGQTGIMIAGEGIPIDSVTADFISGAASLISPDNEPNHWDIIEGQGSLFHPGYSGVSLGLLHGTIPDAFIVCHDANRTISEEGHKLPTIQDCIDLHLKMGKIVNPNIYCAGVCINNSKLLKENAKEYLNELQNQLKVPCTDPLVDGCNPIITYIKSTYRGS